MTSERRYKLKKLLKELKEKKGSHTELVSVYAPQGYSLNEITNQLKGEKDTAQNIKSKTTRKNVLSALDKIIQHLSTYKKTPENGLVIFSGNVSEKEDKVDINLWAVEPPEPLSTRLYWCDQRFELGPLEEMVKEKEVYGMIVVDKNDADIALLKGKKINKIQHLDSIVPGKTRAGGQSSARFQRVREGLLQDFLKKVSETAESIFSSREIKGILIGGPGPIKEDFYENYLSKWMKNKVIGVEDTSYTEQTGLEELLQRSSEILKETEVTKEKEITNKFLEMLQTDFKKVAYGVGNVIKSLEMGAVEDLLISEDIGLKEFEYQCGCGYSQKYIKSEEKQECPKCGKLMEKIGEEDLITRLEEEAKEYSTKVHIVSRDTKEGEQLYHLGGIGAILRFEVEE